MAVINSSRFDFSDVVKDFLDRYTAETVTVMTRVIPQVGKEAAKKLQTQSETPRRTGKYAKAWKCTVEKGRIRTGAIVHAKGPEYRLAHLLEYGHEKRNGERQPGVIHLSTVEQWATSEAFDRIISELEKMTI